LIGKRFIGYSILLFIAFLVIVVIIYLFTFPQVTRCYAINFSGSFTKHSNHLYISKGTTLSQTDTLSALLVSARKRLSGFWGNQHSEPTIIFCHTEEVYRKYGSSNGSPANYFGTPLGTYVVIGPQGLDIDVISHEMCHAELTHRVGWLTMARKIPQWFNEGIALMVDYRYPDKGVGNTYRNYLRKWQQTSMQGQIILPLEDLESVESFYKGDMFRVNLAYLRSGLEVSRWLTLVEQRGLLQLIQGLQNGAAFEEAYQHVEEAITYQ
jgi:hypothetical protein